MRVYLSRLAFAGFACACTLMGVQAAEVRIPGLGGSFALPAKSREELKWDTVVRQQYDFSCGSAAVATLLTYHYGLPTSEQEVFLHMIQRGNQEKIRAQGFSMLDMKGYLDSRGLNSDGFRMSLDDLATIGVPAIAWVNTKGYRHFVVVKGVRGGQVVVGDPAAGTTVIPRELFEQIWNGTVLAARHEIETARAHFNRVEDWNVSPEAPLAQGLGRNGLGTFSLTLPGPNEFGR